MISSMNPKALYLRLDEGEGHKAHIEKLKRCLDGKDRWVVVAKCPTRAKADQMAKDGFGGGPDVRVVDAA